MRIARTPKNHSSLVFQGLRRQVFALIVILAIAGSGALWAYLRINERAMERRINDTISFYKNRMDGIEKQWQAAAIGTKNRLEFMRVLETSRDPSQSLTAYFTVHESEEIFENVMISDSEGQEVFRWGPPMEALAKRVFRAEERPRWYYNNEDETLFRAFYQPIWLGQRGTGVLVLLKRIDNASLYQFSFPTTDTFLTWHGHVVASSNLDFQTHKTPAVCNQSVDEEGRRFESRCMKWSQDDGAPVPVLGFRIEKQSLASSFDLIQLGVFALVGLIISFGLSAWLGFWITSIRRRIIKLSDFCSRFTEDYHLSPELKRHLSEVSQDSPDEISNVAKALEELTGKVIQKTDEVQNAVRTRDESLAAVKESQAHVRLLLDSTAESIVGVNLEGIVIFANQACADMLGYKSSDDFLGKNLHAMIHHTKPDGSPYPQSECPSNVALREKRKVHGENEVFWRADGTSVAVEYWVQPVVRDGEMVGSVNTFTDITARKRATAELKRHAAELAEANLLKDVFTDILRHDILNPIAAIKISNELLLKHEADPRKNKLLQVVHANTLNLIEMTENAAKLAKLAAGERPEFTEAEPERILRTLLPVFEHQLKEKDMTLAVDSNGKFSASFNPMLKDVFSNLISNAIKYGHTGGKIEVKLEDLNESWGFSVKDQGVGIRDEFKQKIFNRFERLGKEGVKGSGLGLTITKHIIALHGGDIWVEDNPEGGSIFKVRLPKQPSTRDK